MKEMGDESAKFFHHFQKSIEGIVLPKQFTFPFSYEPHQLSVMATDEVLCYITAQSAWHKELSLGKMFGVLVARNQRGDIGFFAAFSGQIAGSYQHSYFVPPVYDLSQPGGFLGRRSVPFQPLIRRWSRSFNRKPICDCADL